MTVCQSLLIVTLAISLSAARAQHTYREPHRPQVHFSPQTGWMNDPNGMVYHQGTYHLFYQYYPKGTKWGPMHWGHATSTNLVHWQHRPIALYPDSLGTIFSGSAVADHHNTSGLGRGGKPPLVAIYTYHNEAGAKSGRNDFQTQAIAYSNDNGNSWTKFSGNPVLLNPGITDFRDPKVMWHRQSRQWVMTLATKDRISFYASPDLKQWRPLSEFGAGRGAHGGVWECPDLVSFTHKGKELWVLIVNLNPGGPNGGSATQYFVGDFDGTRFTPQHEDTRWLDYGPDEYAGITWSNTGNRRIFIGWMSNWMYAEAVPTERWRSAMTIPRDLYLREVAGKIYVASRPVKELATLQGKTTTLNNLYAAKGLLLSQKTGATQLPCRIDLSMNTLDAFSLSFSNDAGETVVVGYDKAARQYYIDRSRSGAVGFHSGFAARHTAPRLATGKSGNMVLYADHSSVELFADDGLSVMTSISFPTKVYDRITVTTAPGASFSRLAYTPLSGIWKEHQQPGNK